MDVTHVPRVMHILKPMAGIDIVLNLEISDDKAKFPSLFLPTPRTTPHISHEKNSFTFMISISYIWSLTKNRLWEPEMYRDLPVPRLAYRKPSALLWYHIPTYNHYMYYCVLHTLQDRYNIQNVLYTQWIEQIVLHNVTYIKYIITICMLNCFLLLLYT